MIFAGRNRDGVVRMYHLPLTGDAAPRAITPDDLPLATVGHAVSPDGKRVVVNPARGIPVEFDVDGSGPRPIPARIDPR